MDIRSWLAWRKGPGSSKAEGRNPKSERRPKPEIRKESSDLLMECGGKRSATPLSTDAPKSRFGIGTLRSAGALQISALGFPPSAVATPEPWATSSLLRRTGRISSPGFTFVTAYRYGFRSRIEARIPATVSALGFAPRLPWPWTRTLTLPASMSRAPTTSIVWTFASSACWILPLILSVV
jgi:hypothetical protein